MLSDVDLAGLCCAVYQDVPARAVYFDHFDDGAKDDGVCWALYRALDADVIVLRGSVTLTDWRRDLTFLGDPRKHRDLGAVHYGFLFGMPEMWEEAQRMVGAKVIVAGHSLGAARADVLTALMARAGKPPLATVCFGEPYPGFADFCDLIAALPRRSYCNGDQRGHDLITNVPLPFPPELPYARPSPLIKVSAAPDPDERSAFRYHHMPLYLQALKNQQAI